MPCQRSMCFFTMALGSNHHKINGGDGVELCFFACLHALRRWSKRGSVHGYECLYATIMGRPPGSDTWKEDVRGTMGGAAGAAAPRESRPATAFAWSVFH